ncbi:Tetratricopeptide TPR_1 repeat-containing protein [Phocaeicola salanitronis DSM 18170]|uniref:Tetratricopeptide TPR_1 repeat-containing protein n=2 Tax=Phocaeicola TaxID=909656 RepID=F0R0U6_PHOSB|nr:MULTISPECIES: tetratricopeptide repeat protein [Phocaeicola]ADY37319.1 Tetratricopeptide TPR_1 repeat-containing protein [Phocaeicola salanitronis DSM 18170]MBD8038980.1 tetratricopeptide repeat protein [Phocaeicola intestinalis]
MKHDTLLNRYLKTQIHVYFLFGIFLLLPASLSASSGKERQISLLEKAEQELYTNPQLAVYYTLGAQDSIHSALGQAQALYVYAQAEKLLGNFDNCIQALYEAESKLPSKEIKLRGNIYNLMSLGYCNLGDYSKAIDLSNDAIALFQTEQDSLNLALCYNNRGIIHTYINEYQQADRFLKKALELNRSSHDLKRIAANLNNLCLYKGNIKEQLKWINEAIVINKNLNAKWSLSENYNNLGKLYIYAGKYSQAIDALKTAYRIASEVGAKGLMCDNYEYAAQAYNAIGNYQMAYQKQAALTELSKEIQNTNKLRSVEQRIAQEKMSALQQKERQKQQEYEIATLQRNFITFLVIIVLLTVIGTLLFQRYKRKKKLQLLNAQYRIEQSEHEIAKLKMQQQKADLENAQQALETNKQETMNFAVFLQSRNELLDKIQEQVRQSYRMEHSELIAHLKKLNAFIKQYQTTNKANSTTLQTIDEKSQEFLAHLTERHPNLTQGEKHLASLLRVNLSTKEIAMLTGNTPKTINMNRYRLRKSLGLSGEDDLIQYIQSI